MAAIQQTECILSLGGRTITSTNCILREVTIRTEVGQGYTEVNLSLVCKEINQAWYDDMLGKKQQQLIRNKKVHDCTIEELLFAIRQKLKADN